MQIFEKKIYIHINFKNVLKVKKKTIVLNFSELYNKRKGKKHVYLDIRI